MTDKVVVFLLISKFGQLLHYLQHANNAIFLQSDRFLKIGLILKNIFILRYFKLFSDFWVLWVWLIILIIDLFFVLISKHLEFDHRTLLFSVQQLDLFGIIYRLPFSWMLVSLLLFFLGCLVLFNINWDHRCIAQWTHYGCTPFDWNRFELCASFQFHWS